MVKINAKIARDQSANAAKTVDKKSVDIIKNKMAERIDSASKNGKTSAFLSTYIDCNIDRFYDNADDIIEEISSWLLQLGFTYYTKHEEIYCGEDITFHIYW